MLRYIAAAGALKLFSANRLTRQFYRYLSNTAGAGRRGRVGLPDVYVERAGDVIAQVRKRDMVHSGDSILELGTGWLHWEATILRLFYDVEASIFDVCDNRQFNVFQRYFADFGSVIEREIPMSDYEAARARGFLAELARAQSFEQVYRLLGHRYVVNPQGDLSCFHDNQFSFVVSCSVLEHVDANIIPTFVEGCYRVLKPGGYTLHLIDLSDHLAHYDIDRICHKNYIRYSDATWCRFFQNQVQYFNRVQPREWLSHFASAGFKLVQERRNTINLDGVAISSKYSDMDPGDLACSAMNVIYRKPECA